MSEPDSEQLKKSKPSNLLLVGSSISFFLFALGLTIADFWIDRTTQGYDTKKCTKEVRWDTTQEEILSLAGDVASHDAICIVLLEAGKKEFFITSNVDVFLESGNVRGKYTPGSYQWLTDSLADRQFVIRLEENVLPYQIKLSTNSPTAPSSNTLSSSEEETSLNLPTQPQLRDTSIPLIRNNPQSNASEPIPNDLQKFPNVSESLPNAPQRLPNAPEFIPNVRQEYNDLESGDRYNIAIKPPFYLAPETKSVVARVRSFVAENGFPTDRLSISLVDLNCAQSCGYGDFQDFIPRYPASVSKIFWMVAWYGQVNNGAISQQEAEAFEAEMRKMMQDSDNESASKLIDRMTRTTSGADLPQGELQDWIYRRKWINRFFQKAGYQSINITQKNFPIPYLGYSDGPEERDLQMRYNPENPALPIRNRLTTYTVTRLLYEIYTNQAIAPAYSEKMKAYMSRQSYREPGFLAAGLPLEVEVISKEGWYSGSRHDAAIVIGPSGAPQYILVVFGESQEFAKDEELFPAISRLVYNAMSAIAPIE